MLTLLGNPRRCCDGITRRETLKAGALSALGGFSLIDYLQAAEAGHARPGKAKSVILLYLLGGAATQDMFDMKPKAPPEVRGEFKPVPTNVPGIDICEHLPRMTRWMHKGALIRSVNHKAGCHNCLPSYTGYELPPPDQHPRPTDPPSMGSVCEYLKHNEQKRHAAGHALRPDDFPDYIYMPCWLGWGQAFRRGGPYGGFLSNRYDAMTTVCQPYHDKDAVPPLPGRPAIVRGVPVLPDSKLDVAMTVDRLSSRRSLLSQIDDQRRGVHGQLSGSGYTDAQKRAFDVLTSSKLRAAFDLSKEDPRMLDRYGRTLFGNCALIGRRLVESGVRFVNVTWDLFWGPVNVDYDAWDTHTNNFKILRDNKLPFFDQTYTALLQDLEDRGLLDETLVVVMSEMGRTPRVNANAGRDHWTFCYSVLMAGAGIRGGTVYGASDAQAAYVKDNPVSTADICATIYHCLGIDPDYRVPDHSGRPVPVAQGGEPVWEILA